MEANAKLYTLNYNEVKTYLWAAIFVACNMALPQLFHMIPQGGIIFAPLSLVILAGAYKFGWKVGLLAAVASPLVNHYVFGQPAWGVLQVMILKLVVLALAAGLTAQVYVTGVILPAVTVACNGYLMPQCSQTLCQSVVDVTVFSYQQYLHL